MVNWLDTIIFSDDDIPMFNNSAGVQALKPKQILEYREQLGFTAQKVNLKDSGYRKLQLGDFKLIANVGEVGPTYQPGQVHSDTLSFFLYHKGKPNIEDRGISTFEKKTRYDERRTASHNMVMINGQEQTDVWGGW